jgi:hypothetical protein
MNLRQLLSSKEAFGRLINREWPVKISLNLKKLIRQINIEFDDYDKVRIELLERLGEKKEKNYDFKDEVSRETFDKEMTSLLDEEVELKFYPISVSVLEKNGIQISPIDLELLDWLIVDDTKEQEPKD